MNQEKTKSTAKTDTARGQLRRKALNTIDVLFIGLTLAFLIVTFLHSRATTCLIFYETTMHFILFVQCALFLWYWKKRYNDFKNSNKRP